MREKIQLWLGRVVEEDVVHLVAIWVVVIQSIEQYVMAQRGANVHGIG